MTVMIDGTIPLTMGLWRGERLTAHHQCSRSGILLFFLAGVFEHFYFRELHLFSQPLSFIYQTSRLEIYFSGNP